MIWFWATYDFDTVNERRRMLFYIQIMIFFYELEDRAHCKVRGHGRGNTKKLPGICCLY